MRVQVYVEGPSDRVALEALLAPIIAAGKKNGVGIRFLPLGGKAAVLSRTWMNAADDLLREPGDWAFALPDLYPMLEYDGGAYAHRSPVELGRVLQSHFHKRADKIGLGAEARAHFRVHCLKHDLEALLLAAPDALKRRLGTIDGLHGKWRLPVEDQNDAKPPKRVVEELFKHYRKKARYQETADALWIVQKASLDGIVAGCPQCFAPFVRELRALAEGRDPDAPAGGKARQVQREQVPAVKEEHEGDADGERG